MGMKVAWTLIYSECISKILVSQDTCPGLSDTSMCAHTEIHISLKQFYPVVLFCVGWIYSIQTAKLLNFSRLFVCWFFFFKINSRDLKNYLWMSSVCLLWPVWIRPGPTVVAPDLAPNCFNVCHQKRLAGKVLLVYNPVKWTEYEMCQFFLPYIITIICIRKSFK